jgi:ubiquitin-like modifier-activating enzyme ATG7
VFHDPSSRSDLPGWPLRNVLYYLSHHQEVQRLRVICLRGGNDSSKVLEGVHLPSVETTNPGRPVATGWERRTNGTLGSRLVDLGATMDPTRYVSCNKCCVSCADSLPEHLDLRIKRLI